MSKKLTMSFMTESGQKSSLFFEEPKEDINVEDLAAAMDKLIEYDIFENSDGYSYKGIKGAKVTETTESVLI